MVRVTEKAASLPSIRLRANPAAMPTFESAPDVTLFTLTEPVPAGVADRDEPILLIHGFASSHAVNWVLPLWVKTLTSAGRRTILYDVRGHGLINYM